MAVEYPQTVGQSPLGLLTTITTTALRACGRITAIQESGFGLRFCEGVMSDEFGSDFITISDDEGGEYSLEHICTTELEEETYMLFLPADMDESDPDYGYVILKVVEEDGEEAFSAIENEEEEERVYAAFMELLFDDEDAE
jgi:hypothetical protein